MKSVSEQFAKLVSKAELKRTISKIVECFQPERVILFGSYAEGRANRHSDVDLLVVMPTRNEISQASRIRSKIECPFPLDLIVRTPERLAERLELGDWFLKDVMQHGKIVYEQAHGRVGPQSRGRLASRTTARRRKAATQ